MKLIHGVKPRKFKKYKKRKEMWYGPTTIIKIDGFKGVRPKTVEDAIEFHNVFGVKL